MMTMYDDVMRTIIDVPKEMIQTLDRVRLAEQKSRAALIREAISEYLGKKAVPSAEAAFGLWRQNPEDGVEMQRRLRDEWDDQ